MVALLFDVSGGFNNGASTSRCPTAQTYLGDRFSRRLQLADLGCAGKGTLYRNGIAVTVTPTPDSKFQLTNLIDGKFDIAMTAIDNVIAYMEGQGAAPTSQTAEIFAFMGADNGFLRLVTIPEVKNYEGLKGRQLSVDAMTTGYAFVLRKLLEKGGLKPSEIEFVSAGGVMQRFQALLEKKHAGTLLISPLRSARKREGSTGWPMPMKRWGATRALLAPRAVAGRRTTRKIWSDLSGPMLLRWTGFLIRRINWKLSPSSAKIFPIFQRILPTSRMRSCFIRQKVSRAAPSSTWKA